MSESEGEEEYSNINAEVVEQNFGDGHKVRPGEQFTKSWTIRNTSEGGKAWPANIRFICTMGDSFEAKQQFVQGPVNAEELVVLEVPMIAP